MADVSPTLPEAMQRAVAAYQRGRLREADDLAGAILAIKADYFDALHLIAVIRTRQRRLDEALASYDSALALRPDHVEALCNRGATLHELKRFDEALASYDSALALQPDCAGALYNRGNALRQLKRLDEALASYDRALALEPHHAEVLCNRGNTLYELKRFDEALASYDGALALQPYYARALYNRGNTLHELKQFEEALACYDRALALQPDHAGALGNRGDSLRRLERFDEALTSYDRALALRPDHVETLCSRGAALHELKRFDEALASYDRALALWPDHVEAFSNRGVTLHELKRYEEALASYDRALALRFDHAEALRNRGATLNKLKRFDEALTSYDRALAVEPDYADAHFNKSLLQLLKGDFAAGWREYEWRLKTKRRLSSKRDFTQPLWLGQTAIDGKTILLHAEQGLGDTIQFCRYVPLVAGRGARVLLEVPLPLQDLMAGLAGVAEVISPQEKAPDFDLHCPLLSLPLALGTRVESIPAQVPYVTVPPESLRRWSSAVGAKGKLRIGLAWSGSATHKADAIRSIDLRSLLPLLDIDAEFTSLQKDVRADDATVLNERGDIVHFGDKLDSFADTAAIIANLDLVISVDTSVAHLAGALAKPVWVLLPFLPDFRWLLERQDSPWYPTARLFRQQTPGDWSDVIGRVVIELKKLSTVCETRPFA
jgi:tetratricopeptide (TPR) repeat protein